MHACMRNGVRKRKRKEKSFSHDTLHTGGNGDVVFPSLCTQHGKDGGMSESNTGRKEVIDRDLAC